MSTNQAIVPHSTIKLADRSRLLAGIGVALLIFIVSFSLTNNSSRPAIIAGRSNTLTNSGTPAKTAQTPAVTGAHVGDTVAVSGSAGLAVTIRQILDPAPLDNENQVAPAGGRYVAVEMQLKNNGVDSYQDNADKNVTLTGSDGKTYVATPVNVSGCVDFSNGSYTLGAGESTVGCVAFAVPTGVNVSKVNFVAANLANASGQWSAP